MNPRERQIYKVTIVGSIANVFLLIFKFVAGIIGHSSAMIADAVHSLSDFISDIVVLIFVRLAGRPEDADHAYGHGKYETLASVIVGLLLMIAGFGLFADGVVDTVAFFNGVAIESPNVWALSAAIISILLKEGLYHYTVIYGRRLSSPALVANAWHHRSDSITSIATLIGIGGAMILGPRWNVLDPIAAVIVSCYIVKAAWSLMKPSVDELLEKALPVAQQHVIEEVILTAPGVVSVKRLRTRRIGSNISIEATVRADGDISLRQAHTIASDVERRLRDEFGPGTFISVHMEPASSPR